MMFVLLAVLIVILLATPTPAPGTMSWYSSNKMKEQSEVEKKSNDVQNIKFALKEILMTEETFVSGLEILVSMFGPPFTMDGREGDMLSSIKEIHAMAANFLINLKAHKKVQDITSKTSCHPLCENWEVGYCTDPAKTDELTLDFCTCMKESQRWFLDSLDSFKECKKGCHKKIYDFEPCVQACQAAHAEQCGQNCRGATFEEAKEACTQKCKNASNQYALKLIQFTVEDTFELWKTFTTELENYFINSANMIDFYALYISQLSTLNDQFKDNEFMRKNKEVFDNAKQAIKDKSLKCEVDGLVATPFQRISRYRDLIGELLNYRNYLDEFDANKLQKEAELPGIEEEESKLAIQTILQEEALNGALPTTNTNAWRKIFSGIVSDKIITISYENQVYKRAEKDFVETMALLETLLRDPELINQNDLVLLGISKPITTSNDLIDQNAIDETQWESVSGLSKPTQSTLTSMSQKILSKISVPLKSKSASKKFALVESIPDIILKFKGIIPYTPVEQFRQFKFYWSVEVNGASIQYTRLVVGQDMTTRSSTIIIKRNYANRQININPLSELIAEADKNVVSVKICDPTCEDTHAPEYIYISSFVEPSTGTITITLREKLASSSSSTLKE